MQFTAHKQFHIDSSVFLIAPAFLPKYFLKIQFIVINLVKYKNGIRVTLKKSQFFEKHTEVKAK